MGDSIWYIIMAVIFILLSLIFIRLGWQIWKKQRINLIISYHSDKVSEENKQAYCMRAGIGVFVMGVGFGISGICIGFLQSVFAFIPMTCGILLGILLLISAVIKYNR